RVFRGCPTRPTLNTGPRFYLGGDRRCGDPAAASFAWRSDPATLPNQRRIIGLGRPGRIVNCVAHIRCPHCAWKYFIVRAARSEQWTTPFHFRSATPFAAARNGARVSRETYVCDSRRFVSKHVYPVPGRDPPMYEVGACVL